MKIGVIGAGWVGVTTAATLAHLGHDVRCSDINAERVAKLQKGELTFFEPGLAELLQSGLQSGRLMFTADNEAVVGHGEVIFACVDTPPQVDGAADLSQVISVARDFAKWHEPESIFVIKSTVPAGTCRKISHLIAENGAIAGNAMSFFVAANPEFLAESTAVRDTLQPSRIVIGADDEQTQQRVRAVFAPMLSTAGNEDLAIVLTDTASAEIIKCASNAYLANRISFVNEVANYAVAVGADPFEVARGMSFDKRIGQVRPGVGFGGGCFPKDVRSLLHEGAAVGVPLTILEQAAAVNQRQRERLFNLLSEALGGVAGKRIAILGLAFKPNTDDIREAPAMYFIERLLKEGANVVMYDPRAGKKMSRQFPQAELATTLVDALTAAEAAVALTEWDEFTQFSLEEMQKIMSGRLLIDGRGVWSSSSAASLGFDLLR